MRTSNIMRILTAAAALAAGPLVCAADTRAVGDRPAKVNEPMKTEMMKPGMKMGDVKKAAAEKERRLKRMMEKESAASPKK